MPDTVLLGARSAVHGVAFVDTDLDRLAAHADRAGATVNDALLTAAAAGYRAAIAVLARDPDDSSVAGKGHRPPELIRRDAPPELGCAQQGDGGSGADGPSRGHDGHRGRGLLVNARHG